MKYRVLIAFLILFSACLFGLPLVRSFLEKPIVEEPISLSSEKLTKLVNEWRVKQGFQPYEKNEALCRIAEDRSKDGLDYHKGFREKYTGFPSIISENAATAPSETAAIYEWEYSPKHKENLSKPYRYSCIATKDNFAVQIFSSCENGCP